LNLVVFAFAILAATIVLTKSKAEAFYEGRLRTSLLAYIVVAGLLTIPTTGPLRIDAEIYFPCLLLLVFITAIANALSQNETFAFAAGFRRTEYAPTIMTGEALAGLLPSVVGE
jgi:equilibrative nucleoside transporter 1/2/3